MSDLISRQAAIDSLLKVGDWYVEQGNDEAGRGVAQCQRVIYELPSAERPKGKWKHEHLCSTSGGTYEVVRCSGCAWQYPMWETKYCPNCGAKMEEVEDD